MVALSLPHPSQLQVWLESHTLYTCYNHKFNVQSTVLPCALARRRHSTTLPRLWPAATLTVTVQGRRDSIQCTAYSRLQTQPSAPRNREGRIPRSPNEPEAPLKNVTPSSTPGLTCNSSSVVAGSSVDCTVQRSRDLQSGTCTSGQGRHKCELQPPWPSSWTTAEVRAFAKFMVTANRCLMKSKTPDVNSKTYAQQIERPSQLRNSHPW